MSEPSATPWKETDHDVTAAMVEAALRRAEPGFELESVRFLDAGWDFSAFLVNEAWVFRVPRKAQFEPELIREIDLLGRLDGWLPLPVPRYEFGPLRAEPCPFAFGGYRYLEGVPLVDLEPTAALRTAVATQLAPCMARLHDFPLDGLEGLPDTSYLDKADLVSFRDRVGKRFAGALDGFAPDALVERSRRFFANDVAIPTPFSGTPVLRHTDVHCGHVFVVGPQDHTISALIDWSDASVGDPAGDLAELLPWAGEDFLDELLAHYPVVDEGIRARAHFMGTVVAYPEIAWLRDVGCEAAALRMVGHLDRLLDAYLS